MEEFSIQLCGLILHSKMTFKDRDLNALLHLMNDQHFIKSRPLLCFMSHYCVNLRCYFQCVVKSLDVCNLIVQVTFPSHFIPALVFIVFRWIIQLLYKCIQCFLELEVTGKYFSYRCLGKTFQLVCFIFLKCYLHVLMMLYRMHHKDVKH